MSSPVTLPADSYGSDQSGLISGYLFSGGGVGRAIDSQEAAAWLGQSGASGSGKGFIWLHFNSANAATNKWLEQNRDLSEEFFEALAESSPSTRIEYADENLVATLNDVIYDFFFKESSQVATLWLSIDPSRLISVRRVPPRSIDRLRLAAKSGESFASPLSLFIHLLHDQADVLLAIVRRSATQVDVTEDRLLAGRLDSKRAHLGTLRRDLVRLQRLLAPEPAALFRLLSRSPGRPAEWPRRTPPNCASRRRNFLSSCAT